MMFVALNKLFLGSLFDLFYSKNNLTKSSIESDVELFDMFDKGEDDRFSTWA